MKTVIMSLLVAVSMFCSLAVSGQTHPTIDSLKVYYKPDPQAATLLQIRQEIEGIPLVHIMLVPGADAQLISLRISDPDHNSTIYEIEYNVSQDPVTDPNGNVLFENNNGLILISPGEYYHMRPMNYEIITTDGNSNLSPVFTLMQ